jgi:hypothetical protein
MRAMPLPACLAALVLLMDSSGSVSEAHFRAQREGTAAAFEHHDVVAGLEASDGIAVMVVDFAQVPTTRLPWTMVRTPPRSETTKPSWPHSFLSTSVSSQWLILFGVPLMAL